MNDSVRVVSLAKFLSGRALRRISHGGMIVFVMSIPAMILADIFWGESGFHSVVLWVTYPSLIVGLGTIAANDLTQACILVFLPGGFRENWLGFLFVVSRGLVLAAISGMILRFEFKLLGVGA